MDAKYKLFKRGAVVVDLVSANDSKAPHLKLMGARKGYAPGSWSQVAKDRTGPKGLVVGIDLIPAQPPRGVSTIQGNFLSPSVRDLVKTFVAEGAARKQMQQQSRDAAIQETEAAAAANKTVGGFGRDEKEGTTTKTDTEDVVLVDQTSYIDAERLAARDALVGTDEGDRGSEIEQEKRVEEERLVDVSFA
jgi:21S rRNA (uridine2791-2'-O)-methyltransferase